MCPDLADRSLANFDDYDNYDDYGDYYGDVTAGVTSMEEYKEQGVVLSDVVLPMVLVVLMVAHGDPAGPRTSLLCARTIPAAECPPAPLQDTADCSPADIAPATYPDLADRSPSNFAPTTLRKSTDPSPVSVFNRQCLTGSAHRPSDLIASARLLSTHGG